MIDDVQGRSAARKGIRHMTDGVDRKMAVSGTEKYNQLVASGYTTVGGQC